MTSEATDVETRFLQWLVDNGATFPKIRWPVKTPSGLRGATAIEDIAPFEPMLCVPKALMITEETCRSDEQLGPIFKQNRDVFAKDDPVIALFLVRELVRGDESFFAPYLAMLPYPTSVQDWTEQELDELYDRRLVDAAARRVLEISVFYERIFTRLDDKHSGKFPREQYTFERFAFAWKSIQARTFGRRLPWTSLVPLADCLNHTNVATRYDFDLDRNGLFRLYPSGSTSYAAGSEVFNSYGRRSNFQLLLDYGFALERNEWDVVDIELPKDRPRPLPRRLRFDSATTVNELFASPLLASLQTRTTVYEWLRGILQQALESFPCSMEQEENLLSSGVHLDERLRAAIVYRLNRMKIIDRILKQLDHKLTDLDGEDGESNLGQKLSDLQLDNQNETDNSVSSSVN